MAVTVTHTTAATQPDSADGKISSNAWNEEHTINGLATVASTGAFADLTGAPTTLAGYGITDAQPLNANLTAYAGANWAAGVMVPALTAASTITLKTVGSASGNLLDKAAGDTLYQPVGSYLTGNQTITLSGDLSGSGSTAITGTLATVNSNVGSFGSATQSLTATVDGKGRITAISAQTATPAFSSISGKPTTVSGYGITDAGYIIAQSAVASSHTGDTATTTLATITIPAGAMGANGVLAVKIRVSRTGATSTLTTSATFGGTSVLSKAFGTTVTTENYVLTIANRNNTSSQFAEYVSTNSGGTQVTQSTAAIDTTASVTLLIRGACTNAGDTITLESYQVILYPKA